MSKRARGVYEYPRSSGKFWIQYFDQGRRHRELIGTEKLAIAVREKRMTEIRENRFFPELRRRKILFSQLCDDFEQHKPEHWSGGMFTRVRNWFAPLPAASITPHQIDQKLNEMIKAGSSPATANRYRAITSAVFSWAVRNGKITSNPARAVSLRREDNSRIRFLSPAEESRLRRAAVAAGGGAVAELDLAIHTGMRRGEQYGLRWQSVDMHRGMITLLRTKSGEARHIPLNQVARRALQALRLINTGERVCGFLEPRHWFYEARKAAKLPDFRWHELRHTFASRLVMAGVDLRTVQELMGHKSISMTVRYAHLSPRHTQNAVDRLAGPAIKTATARKQKLRKMAASH